MSKRSNGEGTVDRLPSGRYRGRLAVMGDDGRMVRRTVTGATSKEVRDRLRDLRIAADKGKPITEGRETLRQYVEHWSATVLLVSVRQSTADQYAGLLAAHVLPVLGDKRMATIRPSDIEILVHGLQRSQSTKRSVYAALRKCWAAALRDGVVPRDVVREVARPTLEAYRPTAPGVSDVKALIAAAKGTRLECLVILLATTGLRRGELLALRWSDAQESDGVMYLSVSGSLTRASDGLRRRAPKTNAGTRSIPLPALAVSALRRQRAQQATDRLAAGSAWVESGYIITTPVGGACEPRNVSRAYAAMAEKAKVPAPGMHALRHYAATVMLDGGSSPREVADQLGHSSPVATLELYAATVPESQRAAVERAAALLGGA